MSFNLNNIEKNVSKFNSSKLSADFKAFLKKEYKSYRTSFSKSIAKAAKKSPSSDKLLFEKLRISPLELIGATSAKDLALYRFLSENETSSDIDTSWVQGYAGGYSLLPLVFIKYNKGVVWGFKSTDRKETKILWVVIKTNGKSDFFNDSKLTLKALISKLGDRVVEIDVSSLDIAKPVSDGNRYTQFRANGEGLNILYNIQKKKYKVGFSDSIPSYIGLDFIIDEKPIVDKDEVTTSKSKPRNKVLKPIVDEAALYKLFLKQVSDVAQDVAKEVNLINKEDSASGLLNGVLNVRTLFSINSYLSSLRSSKGALSLFKNKSYLNALNQSLEKLNDTREIKDAKLNEHDMFFALIFSLKEIYRKGSIDFNDIKEFLSKITSLKSGVYNVFKLFIPRLIKSTSRVGGRSEVYDILMKGLSFADKRLSEDLEINDFKNFKQGKGYKLKVDKYLIFLSKLMDVDRIDDKLIAELNSIFSKLGKSGISLSDYNESVFFLFLTNLIKLYQLNKINSLDVKNFISKLKVNDLFADMLENFSIYLKTLKNFKFKNEDLEILKEKMGEAIDYKKVIKEELARHLYKENLLKTNYKNKIQLGLSKIVNNGGGENDVENYRVQMNKELFTKFNELRKDSGFTLLTLFDAIYNATDLSSLAKLIADNKNYGKAFKAHIDGKTEVNDQVGSRLFYTLLNKISSLYVKNYVIDTLDYLDNMFHITGFYNEQINIFKANLLETIKSKSTEDKSIVNEVFSNIVLLNMSTREQEFYQNQMFNYIKRERSFRETGSGARNITSLFKTVDGEDLSTIDDYKSFVNGMIYPLLKKDNILGVKLLFNLYAKLMKEFAYNSELSDVLSSLIPLDNYKNIIKVLMNQFINLSSKMERNLENENQIGLAQNNFKSITYDIVNRFILDPSNYKFTNCDLKDYQASKMICIAFNQMLKSVYGIQESIGLPNIKQDLEDGASSSEMEIVDNKNPEVKLLEKERELKVSRTFCYDNINEKAEDIFNSPGSSIIAPNEIKIIFIELSYMIRDYYELNKPAKEAVKDFYDTLSIFDKKMSFADKSLKLLPLIIGDDNFNILVNEDVDVVYNIFQAFTSSLFKTPDAKYSIASSPRDLKTFVNPNISSSSENNIIEKSKMINKVFNKYLETLDVIDNKKDLYFLDKSKLIHIKELGMKIPSGTINFQSSQSSSEIDTSIALKNIISKIGANVLLGEGNVLDNLILPNGNEYKTPYDNNSKFEKSLLFFKNRLYNASDVMDILFLFSHMMKLSDIIKTHIDSNNTSVMNNLSNRLGNKTLMESLINGNPSNNISIEDIEDLNSEDTPERLYEVFIKYIVDSMDELSNELKPFTTTILRKSFNDVKDYIRETISKDLRARAKEVIKEHIFSIKPSLKSSDSNMIKVDLYHLVSKIADKNDDLVKKIIHDFEFGNNSLNNDEIERLFNIIDDMSNFLSKEQGKKEFDQLIIKLKDKMPNVISKIQNISQNYVMNAADVFTSIDSEIFNIQTKGSVLNLLNIDDNIQYWADQQLLSVLSSFREKAEEARDVKLAKLNKEVSKNEEKVQIDALSISDLIKTTSPDDVIGLIRDNLSKGSISQSMINSLVEKVKGQFKNKNFLKQEASEDNIQRMIDESYMKASRIKKRRRPFQVKEVSYSSFDDLYLNISNKELPQHKIQKISDEISKILSLLSMGKIIYRNAKLIEGGLSVLLDKDGNFNTDSSNFAIHGPIFKGFYSEWYNSLNDSDKKKVNSDISIDMDEIYIHEEDEFVHEEIDYTDKINEIYKNGVKRADVTKAVTIDNIIDGWTKIDLSDDKHISGKKIFRIPTVFKYNDGTKDRYVNTLSQDLNYTDFKYMVQQFINDDTPNFKQDNGKDFTNAFSVKDLGDTLKKAAKFNGEYIARDGEVVGQLADREGWKNGKARLLFKDEVHRDQTLINLLSTMLLGADTGKSNLSYYVLDTNSKNNLIEFLFKEQKLIRNYSGDPTNTPFINGLKKFKKIFSKTNVYLDMLSQLKEFMSNLDNKKSNKYKALEFLDVILSPKQDPLEDFQELEHLSIEERQYFIEKIHTKTLSLGGLKQLELSKSIPSLKSVSNQLKDTILTKLRTTKISKKERAKLLANNDSYMSIVEPKYSFNSEKEALSSAKEYVSSLISYFMYKYYLNSIVVIGDGDRRIILNELIDFIDNRPNIFNHLFLSSIDDIFNGYLSVFRDLGVSSIFNISNIDKFFYIKNRELAQDEKTDGRTKESISSPNKFNSIELSDEGLAYTVDGRKERANRGNTVLLEANDFFTDEENSDKVIVDDTAKVNEEKSLPLLYKEFLENKLSSYMTQVVFTEIERGNSLSSFSIADVVNYSKNGFGKALNYLLGEEIPFNKGLNENVSIINNLILKKISESIDNIDDIAEVSHFAINFKTINFGAIKQDAGNRSIVNNTSSVIDFYDFKKEIIRLSMGPQGTKAIMKSFTQIDKSMNKLNSLILSQSESMALLGNNDIDEDVRLVQRIGGKGIFVNSRNQYLEKDLNSLKDKDRSFLKAVSDYELFRIEEVRDAEFLKARGIEWVTLSPKTQFYSPNKNISEVRVPDVRLSQEFFNKDKTAAIHSVKSWLTNGYNKIGQSNISDFIEFLKGKIGSYHKEDTITIINRTIAMLGSDKNKFKKLYTVKQGKASLTYISNAKNSKFSLNIFSNSGIIDIMDKDTNPLNVIVKAVITDLNKYNRVGFLRLKSESFAKILRVYTEKGLKLNIDDIKLGNTDITSINKLTVLRFERLVDLLKNFDEIFLVSGRYIIAGYIPLDIYIGEELSKIKIGENISELEDGRYLSETSIAAENYKKNKEFFAEKYDIDSDEISIEVPIKEIIKSNMSSSIDVDDTFYSEGTKSNPKDIKIYTKDMPFMMNNKYNVGNNNSKYSSVISNAIMELFLSKNYENYENLKSNYVSWFNGLVNEDSVELNRLSDIINNYHILNSSITKMMKLMKGNFKINEKEMKESEVLGENRIIKDGKNPSNWVLDYQFLNRILDADMDILINMFLSISATGLINGERNLYTPLYFSLIYNRLFLSDSFVSSETYLDDLTALTNKIDGYFNDYGKSEVIFKMFSDLLNAYEKDNSETSGKLYTLRYLYKELGLMSNNYSESTNLLKEKLISESKNDKNLAVNLNYVTQGKDDENMKVLYSIPHDYLGGLFYGKGDFKNTAIVLSKDNKQIFNEEIFKNSSAESIELGISIFNKFFSFKK